MKEASYRGFFFFYPLNDESDHLKIHNERLSYLILIGEKYLKGILNISHIRKNAIIITKNNNCYFISYPQYTTNFWGTNADNNYGFGSSNIGSNVENMQTMTPIPHNKKNHLNGGFLMVGAERFELPTLSV